MGRRKLRRLFYLLPIILLTGCVKDSANGDEHVFTYELWVPGAILLGGLVAAPFGWVTRNSWGRFGWAMLILGPLAAFGLAPSMFMDRLAVNHEGFDRHSGFFGLSAAQNVKFANLSQMRLIAEESFRKGRKRTNYFLMCEGKDGSSTKVPLSNDLVEAASPFIAQYAQAAGISVRDETGDAAR